MASIAAMLTVQWVHVHFVYDYEPEVENLVIAPMFQTDDQSQHKFPSSPMPFPYGSDGAFTMEDLLTRSGIHNYTCTSIVWQLMYWPKLAVKSA